MATNTYMEGKIFINFRGAGGGGFVENYKMPGDDYPAAKTAMAAIIDARRWLLAHNWVVVHSTVSKKNVRGDSSIPYWANSITNFLGTVDDPNTPEADLSLEAQCNDREASLSFLYDTGVGLTTNRLIRAVRDTWITGNVFNLTVADITPAFSVVATVIEDDPAVAVANYLRTVAFYTRFMQKVPATNPQQYEAIDWARISFDRVATRDMGKGYSGRKARRKTRI